MEIVLKTRVIIYPSDFYDYKDGIFDETQARPVWRRVGYDASDIYRVIQYDHEKCLIKDLWGDTYLIKEPFEDVFRKWCDNKQQTERTAEEQPEIDDKNSPEEDEDNLDGE